MEYEYWQWIWMAVAALIIGMSKCGIPGLGILNVAILQNLLLAKQATGFGLPLLMVGDLCSLLIFRRHADWAQLRRLFPWTAGGVVLGYFALGAISDSVARILIGFTLLALLVLHFVRSRRKGEAEVVVNSFVAPIIGVMAGFVSMVANAAGPIMIIYLLAMRLPKMAFIGTSVVFFTCMNAFKLPFLIHLNLVTLESVAANIRLTPLAIAGCVIGYFYAKKISQKYFEAFAFWLTVAAVLYMLRDVISL
ncbi:sulfite exporter TauE/SafE family protein [Puniceicoccaceae bacterium K14]|nr:sulfite exporter TauE/SafE family protein [Puniceicoccaceae bacterium K14]